MLIGYGRVSITEQNLDFETDALNRAGCAKLFTETASGARSTPPGSTRLSNISTGATPCPFATGRPIWAAHNHRSFRNRVSGLAGNGLFPRDCGGSKNFKASLLDSKSASRY